MEEVTQPTIRYRVVVIGGECVGTVEVVDCPEAPILALSEAKRRYGRSAVVEEE